MTTPHTIYAALVARFGREAVHVELLGGLGIKWVDGEGAYSAPDVIHGNNPLPLPEPAAVVLLCDVAERLLGLDWLIIRDVHDMANIRWQMLRVKDGCEGVYDKWTDLYPTKPAAVLAALESEAK